jgi:sodium/hydrogen antiporter
MEKILSLDLYNFYLLAFGIITLLAATVPHLVKNRAITGPILYIVIGILIWQAGTYFSAMRGLDDLNLIERLAEFVVIVALTNAGLKIVKPFSWKTWKHSIWLLAIAMPITMVGAAFLGYWIIGLAPAAAALYGAIIAPTDPVLASDIQTTAPSEGDHSKTRLALTSEAGLNDGLAFPFTYFAIFMVTKGSDISSWIGSWFLVEFLYKIAAGTLIGWFCGWLLFRLIFQVTAKDHHSKISRGILALALTLLPYAVCEILGGYGFIAVFVSAATFSNSEHVVEHMDNLHDFTEEIEGIFVAFLFVLIGVYLASNYESMLTYGIMLTATLMIFVVRPLSGFISLIGSNLTWLQRGIISFYGIRGIGSIYYLAFALTKADFPDFQPLVQLTAATIILSVLIHGMSATYVMRYLEDHEKRSR